MTNSTNPKICPCSDPVKDKETFFWFIIIFDLIFGMGILSLISLCVYCSSKNFHSCYFKCYAITRLIFHIIAAILVVIVVIALFFIDHKDKVVLFIVFLAIMTPLLTWGLYLSFQFNSSITDYQNEKSTNLIEEAIEKEPETKPEAEEIKNDIEKNGDEKKIENETK